MKVYTSSDISQQRVSKWIEQAKPVDANPVWNETRLAIDFGGHTYIVDSGQTFQCTRCGHYDPEWTVTEVLSFFEQLGIKPYEITISCSVAKVVE